MGMTPDSVKSSPEYTKAKRDYDVAFSRLRDFNGTFVKQFAQELRDERQAKRLALQTVEPGAEGKPQTVLQGAERISEKKQAQREADKPMRPKVPQKDAGELFDEQARSEKQDTLFAVRRASTDTPAFKKWFGDSAVVDAQGKPLVVYHGSNAAFEAFEKRPGERNFGGGYGQIDKVPSQAFFFTPDKETADLFAKSRTSLRSDGKPKTRAFYLSVENPLDLTGGRFGGRVPDPDTASVIGEAQGLEEGDGPQTWAEVQQALDDPGVVGELRNQGFDGVKLLEQNYAESWAVFDPTQIKSVDNSGAFDPTDPRVRAKARPDTIQPTDAFKAQAQAIGKRLRAELDRLGLKDIGLRISETLGMMVDGTMHAADGQYFQKLITIALDAENPDATLAHEAIHALRELSLFGKDEWAILERQSRKKWMAEHKIAEAYGAFPEWVQVEEGIAHAYGEWSRQGTGFDGIIIKAFRKIKAVLRAIARAFGKDFTSAEDVFAKIDSGEVGSRPGNVEFFKLPADSTGEARFELRRAPKNQEESQEVMQGFIARGQPIDRAIRLPFEILGGLDEKGQWNPGKRVTGKVKDIILNGKIDPHGRFGWMSGIAENVRRGLVDRYGLDPAYVEAEQRRALNQRGVLQKAEDILKVLSGAGVGTQEAKVLQAILTGEAVDDAAMLRVALPIRQAIDDLGAEAVSLGLISADSYERNRGSYLHRVYMKNEIDQGTMAGWVSAKMASRRRRILGDSMKGRGLFWEVAAERLLQQSEAAQAMRKADTGIGTLEKNIDDLAGRRDTIEAEIKALGREMAAHLGRRMDVADRATIKKMVGDTRVTNPTGFQKGQVREQAVALNRLRDSIEQREEAIARIEGRIAAAEQRIDALSDHMIAQSEDLAVTKGRKFVVLDKKATADGKEKVTQRVYVPADEAIPARFAGPGWVNQGEWETRSVGKGKITLWRDYTKDERTKMGEILDARYTIGKTFMLMANDLANGRFFKEISENAGWATSEQPATGWRDAGEYGRFWNDPEVAWVKVPDSNIPDTGGKKRWGALAGKFVRAEIWRDLNEVQIASTPGPWRKLLRQWKLNKTARNPVVHMNNVMSNMVFMDMADVRAQDLVAGIRAYATSNKDFKEARDNGAFGSDMMAQEIRDNVLKPLLEEIASQQQGGVANSFLARAGMLGKVADKLFTWAKTADDGMIRAYQAEDELFRMATYLRRRSQGDSPAAAAANARETFLDYDIRAPWVNAARNTVLPFISYTYRAVPKIAESIAHRPWKLAKYMAIAYAVNALAYLWDDGDDGEDRERAALRDEEQGNTWFGTPRMLRMPWRDENGLPVFLDVRRWMPAGDIFDTNQGSSALPIPAPLQFGGPLQLAFEFLLNRQAFTGKDITNDLTDDAADKTANVADWLWKAWAPSALWVPNSWYWSKMSNAIHGASDATGRKYSVTQAFLSSIGIKVRPLDVEDGLSWHAYDFKKVGEALQAAGRALSRQRDRNLISQEAFDSGMAKLTEKFGNLDAEYKALGERTQKKSQ